MMMTTMMMDVSSYHRGHTVSLIRGKYKNKKSVLRVEAFFVCLGEKVSIISVSNIVIAYSMLPCEYTQYIYSFRTSIF